MEKAAVNYTDKEDNNFDGYSTPSQAAQSKISARRNVKSFEKSESQINKQMAKNDGAVLGTGHPYPESRGTQYRYGYEPNYPAAAPYSYNMGMMPQPNIHYVHSSFDRPS